MKNIWSTIKPTEENYDIKTIDKGVASKYQGDFIGLLISQFGVTENLVWPNIYINGLHSSSDYDGVKTEIKIINPEYLALYE